MALNLLSFISRCSDAGSCRSTQMEGEKPAVVCGSIGLCNRKQDHRQPGFLFTGPGKSKVLTGR